MELLKFFIAIFLLITCLFVMYLKWRLPPIIFASLRKPIARKSNLADRIEGGMYNENRTLTRIIISHLTLYLIIFLTIIICGLPRGLSITEPWHASYFWLWDTRYISPTVRNIILLVMVIIIFPTISVIYELERRKAKGKKQNNILPYDRKIN
jgi:hypothetical protein